MDRKKLTVKDLIELLELTGNFNAVVKITEGNKIMNVYLDQVMINESKVINMSSLPSIKFETNHEFIIDTNEVNYMKYMIDNTDRAFGEDDEIPDDDDEYNEEDNQKEIQALKDNWPGNKYIVHDDEC